MTAIQTFAVKNTMSSREIAHETGKQHKHVLDSIRSMEEAWIKTGRPNFRLTYYTDQWGRQQPQYELSKVECLYIATKFNDEARARLIIRWEELENAQPKVIDFSHPETVLQLAQNWAEERKLREAAEEKLKIAEPKAIFADAVAHSQSAILVNALAKILNQKGVDIGGIRLFEWLRENGYLCRIGRNNNVPTQKAMNMGLFEISETAVSRSSGTFTAITPYVTGKGQVYFVNKFLKQQ